MNPELRNLILDYIQKEMENIFLQAGNISNSFTTQISPWIQTAIIADQTQPQNLLTLSQISSQIEALKNPYSLSPTNLDKSLIKKQQDQQPLIIANSGLGNNARQFESSASKQENNTEQIDNISFPPQSYLSQSQNNNNNNNNNNFNITNSNNNNINKTDPILISQPSSSKENVMTQQSNQNPQSQQQINEKVSQKNGLSQNSQQLQFLQLQNKN
eukprot:TRINITY_DN2316_c0_g2_i1.p2 TRINITY_DN2316_c0_g2~~TRINITY_DN2316_c0_g2_i1.p2  ORF type:complete len:215 (+),score=42.36 TRINITY_DN2316_c0_g2_i1:266-910(+)